MEGAGGARRRPTASARKARGSPEPAEEGPGRGEKGTKGNPKGKPVGEGQGGGFLGHFDAALSRKVYDWASLSVPRGVLKAFEHAGSGLLWFPLSLLIWFLPVDDTYEGIGADHWRGFGAFLFIGMLIELAVVGTLKVLVRRPRPAWNKSTDFLLVASADQWSFPSGHASRAVQVVLWLVCAFNYYMEADGDEPRQWYPIMLTALGWALATAFSRVALGRHYLSDMLVGALIGTAIVGGVSRGTFTLMNANFGKFPPSVQEALMTESLPGGAAKGLDFDFLAVDVRHHLGHDYFVQNIMLQSKPGQKFQDYIDRVNDVLAPPAYMKKHDIKPEPLYRAVLNLKKLTDHYGNEIYDDDNNDDSEEEEDFLGYFEPINVDGVPIDSSGNPMTKESGGGDDYEEE